LITGVIVGKMGDFGRFYHNPLFRGTKYEYMAKPVSVIIMVTLHWILNFTLIISWNLLHFGTRRDSMVEMAWSMAITSDKSENKKQDTDLNITDTLEAMTVANS